ncbi:MAG: hypothetical protein N2688_15425, partial [Burkholderiaceae bacterium]|nr:hypothetical protein [Burkholderiaceae bacterium]
MNPERALRVAWVLWPSFLVAAAAEVVFFAVFDPADLRPFGVPIDADRLPLYTVFFFFFWLIGAAASASPSVSAMNAQGAASSRAL